MSFLIGKIFLRVSFKSPSFFTNILISIYKIFFNSLNNKRVNKIAGNSLKLFVIWTALFITVAVCTPALAQVSVNGTNFEGGRWVQTTETLIIRLDGDLVSEKGRIAVFVDKMDLTSQFQQLGSEIHYTPTIIPLTPGQKEITIYFVSEIGLWKEVARISLQVLTESGFESAQFDPFLDINVNSQFVEQRSIDAGPGIRSTPNIGINFQGGFDSEHTKGDFAIRSHTQIVGSSFQREALRFGEKENEANQVELSEYLIEMQKGSSNLQVGHISYGNHPHLLNGVGSRGVHFNYNLMDRAYFSVVSMNATSIVGWDNPVGLYDLDHNITAQTVGVDLLQHEQGKVNLEFTHMNASKKAEGNFNEGQVVDVEESDGLGVRLAAENVFGRMNTNVGFARSTYNNPDDPQLSAGFTLVDVKETTDHAYDFDMTLDIIQNQELFPDQFFSFTTAVKYERVDPLYNSLGASVTADLNTEQYEAIFNLGEIRAQYQHLRTVDNLDDIATILKTKTRGHLVTFALPLPSLIGEPGLPNLWFPNISYVYNNVHQFGVQNAALFASGFTSPSQIPDQYNRSHVVDANWTGSWWTFTYNFSQSVLDNTQVGREKDDLTVFTNQVSLGTQILDNLSTTVGYGRTESTDENVALVRLTNSIDYSMNWNFLPNWFFSGNFSFIEETDSSHQAFSYGHTANAQLARQFELPGPGGNPIPGRAFLIYSKQKNFFRDSSLSSTIDNRVWGINAGFSLSLF